MPPGHQNESNDAPSREPSGRRDLPDGLRRLARRARRVGGRLARSTRARLSRTSTPFTPSTPLPAACGVVESLNGKEILGWVHVPALSGPVRVGLYLNEVEVDHVEPAPKDNRLATGEVRAFRFKLRDVWKYCGPEDRLSVRVDGAPLPMTGRGMFYRPRNQGPMQLAELQRRLRSGHVFASNGALNQSKTDDVEWQDAVIGLYTRVRQALKEMNGYDAFFIYGSLLGAVRDHNFIGHDFDFDAAYLSRHRDPDRAGAELSEIALGLLERGFQVESRAVCLHIHDAIAGRERIDLFHLFFDQTGVMQFTWGVAGTTPFRDEQWKGVEEIPFARTTGLVPRNAEALVETMYGPHWRIPNPGFAWARDRTRKSLGGRVPLKPQSQVNWIDFWGRTTFDQPSSFFATAVARDAVPRSVVDLGCGDGRDSLAFAVAGHRVLGLDWSRTAISRATERAETLSEDRRPTFATCDFDAPDAVGTVITSWRADSEPVLFYGRFLLHALFEDTQDRLLQVVAGLSQPGDVLALEFRAEEDVDRPKWNRLPYRRFLKATDVVDQLHRLGFAVSHQEEGIGLSPHESEDPYLHRLIATRTASDPQSVPHQEPAWDRAAAEIAALAHLELTRQVDAAADETSAESAGPGLRFTSTARTQHERDEELKAVAFALIDAKLSVECQNNDIVVSTPSGSVVLGPDGDREIATSPETVEEIYWANFYAHTQYTSGSTFCAKVVEIDGSPTRVIDIGCGDGRDSYAFASAGRSVLGVDRSHIGVEHASRKARELDHQETARFVACDVADVERLREIFTSEMVRSEGAPELFYARFFLHSIPEDVQDHLMTLLAEVARPGDWFAAEFRTDDDAEDQKVHQKHYRRFQNGPAFGRQLEQRFGFTILEVEQGRGLSPYKGEDPHLYRVIARQA